MLGTRFHVVSITPPVSSDGVLSALSLYSSVFILDFIFCLHLRVMSRFLQLDG